MAMSDLTLDDLPDQLLGRVLALAGRSAGPAVTLVSKRWWRVFFSEPALWRPFKLRLPAWTSSDEHRQQWFHGMLGLLSHVGHLLTAVKVDGQMHIQPASTREDVAALLLLLQPSVLTELQLDFCPVTLHMIDDLASYSQLTSLHICCDWLWPVTAAALSLLPQLRSLHCCCELYPSGGKLPEELLGSITELTRLQVLEIAACLPGLPLQQLTRLTGLQRLVLRQVMCESGYGLDSVAQPPTPRQFPALQAYAMSSDMANDIFEVAGTVLEKCQFDAATGELQLDASGGGRAVLQQPLLEALLPAGAPFSRLVLFGVELNAAALASCSQLSSVRSVLLRVCSVSADIPAELQAAAHHSGCWKSACMDLVLQALLQQAPSLTDLAILGGEHDAFAEFPASLCSSQGLKHLRLQNVWLEDVPPGPYLSGLLELDLSYNRLKQLPPALMRAQSLTKLVLSGNGYFGIIDRQPMTEMGRILGGLPLLRELHLEGCYLKDIPPGSYLAGLDQLNVASSSLSKVPPALAAATALTCLDLSSSLKEVASAELEAHLAGALSQMPQLKHLSLRGNGLAMLPGGAYLTGLEMCDLSDNNFSHLPPALSTATALRTLLLRGCRQLELSTEQEADMLLYMPRLRLLRLGRTILCRKGRVASPQLLQRLHSCAPELEVDESYPEDEEPDMGGW